MRNYGYIFNYLENSKKKEKENPSFIFYAMRYIPQQKSTKLNRDFVVVVVS